MADTDLLLRSAAAANEAGNPAHALACYEQGAALGDGACWHGLGYMIDTGEGIEADHDRAMVCYRKGWKAGFTASGHNIAIHYRDLGDRRAMFRWFQRVALAGDPGGYVEMAKCYRDGTGVRKSHARMMECIALVRALGLDGYEDDVAEIFSHFRHA